MADARYPLRRTMAAMHIRRLAPRFALLVLAACALCVPSTADASAWTAKDDELTLGLTYDFQHARQEFLPGGLRQPFPLEGRFSGSQLTLKSGYGITDAFEIAGSLAFKHVSYEADPVILGFANGADSADRVQANESILDFSQTALGAADLRLSGTYQFLNLDGMLVGSTETELKLPTGYDKPESTFKDDQPTPDNLRDDVSLGDGQTDITQSFLLGAFVPATGTFSHLDGGFRLRFGRPGHQLTGGFKLGQFIGDSVMLFGRIAGTLSVTDGQVIGQTFTAEDPTVASNEFSADNVQQRDLTLSRDYLQVGGGAVVRLEAFELQASYRHVLLGENIPALHTGSLSIIYRMENLSGG